jgi:DNA-binding NtrC family response regulator
VARRPARQVPPHAGSANGSLPLPAQGYSQPPASQLSPASQPPPPQYLPVSLFGGETVSLKDIARQAALRAEREAIGGMLARTNWNKRKAAARLQISYKALLYKIKDCGLTDPRITASLADLPPLTLAVSEGSEG